MFWMNSSQVRPGGKRSLKKSPYQGGDGVYLYHNPGFGDGEYSVPLVEWRALTTFTMFCYVQTINEANFWRDTCVTVLEGIFLFLISWRAVVSRQLPDFNTFMQIFRFSPILYSLRRLLAFPMMHLSAFILAYQFHSFNTVIWDRFQNN